MAKVETLNDILREIQNNKEKIKAFGVIKIGVFGSFARGEQSKDSDIDFLVEFQIDKKTFRNFIDLAFFLEDRLERKVELVTTESLSPYFKSHILETVEYARVA